DTMADLLGRIGWGFAAVVVVRLAYISLRARALHRSCGSQAIAYSDVWRIRLASEAVEVVTLTGPFLAEPTKGWLLKRRGLSTTCAFGAVVVEYVIYTLASAWMAATALALLVWRHALPGALDHLASIFLCIVGA